MTEIAEYESRMGYHPRDEYLFHRQRSFRRAMEERRARMVPPPPLRNPHSAYPHYRSLDSPSREYRTAMNPIAREFKPRKY